MFAVNRPIDNPLDTRYRRKGLTATYPSAETGKDETSQYNGGTVGSKLQQYRYAKGQFISKRRHY